MIFTMDDENLQRLVRSINELKEKDSSVELLGNIVTVPVSTRTGFGGDLYFEFKYLATMQRNENKSF